MSAHAGGGRGRRHGAGAGDRRTGLPGLVRLRGGRARGGEFASAGGGRRGGGGEVGEVWLAGWG